MTWLYIEQTDVWLFRDGKPFSAGEEHMAQPLSTVANDGSRHLRGMLLGHSMADWQAYREQQTHDTVVAEITAQIGHPSFTHNGIENPPALGNFSVAGPFLARREEDDIVRYLPLPSDVVKQKDTESYFALRPSKNKAMVANWPQEGLVPLWSEVEDDIEAPDGSLWLEEAVLNDYLQGRKIKATKAEELYGVEPRFGTAIDYEHGSVRESMLYQAEFVRTRKNVGLLVKLGEDVTVPAQQGTIAFGGEARGARYEIIPESGITVQTGVSAPSQRLKVMLLTPAYFSGGWYPAQHNWSKFFNGQPVNLVAASIGTAQRLGGWDVAHNIPKPMRAYAPAGSVFFFESDQPILPPSGPLTETPGGELSLSKQGFGQIAVGTWEWL
ncbi:MAG: type III-B CRISPR module-associated Cmr3 family protein [Caldilineaceae bacterium]